MSAVNKVILIGNLGKDPEVRYFEHERVRASFSLATHDTYKNKEGQKITTTEWHNVVLWSSLAKVAAQYLTKGKQIYVEGRLATRSYEGKDGQVKYITEVVGQNMVLLGGSGKSNEEDIPLVEPAAVNSTDEHPDGLPF